MYEIKAHWAAYQLYEYTADSETRLNEIVAELEGKFLAGIETSIQGSIMQVHVLCVDVFLDGKLVQQIDYK